MKFEKHFLINLISLCLLLIETWDKGKDSHDSVLIFAFIVFISGLIVFIQLFYYFIVSRIPKYNSWFDVLFYGLITFITFQFYQKVGVRYGLFNYIIVSILFEFGQFYFKRNKSS